MATLSVVVDVNDPVASLFWIRCCRRIDCRSRLQLCRRFIGEYLCGPTGVNQAELFEQIRRRDDCWMRQVDMPGCRKVLQQKETLWFDFPLFSIEIVRARGASSKKRLKQFQ
jgi:hypothetical protein